jgi:hypothetical protein
MSAMTRQQLEQYHSDNLKHEWYKKLLVKLETIREGKLDISEYIGEVKSKIKIHEEKRNNL